ncbi:Threonine synthase [Elusimicrobium minutum Pei191]|uniref:Threonine synthase n=1 Tax=Elusimicrobium minutum (strain Pei191) TaxID=445932 RepID=B2KD18_ELUMP|nr:threonine synthase [Elusimicrobium minutum]ACC98414.1 Threonine synthase [Elusimicrobium minutum Pei191]
MKYIDTRGGNKTFNFEQVLLGGLTENGGLYVPETLPKFTKSEIESMRGLSYNGLAFKILRPFTEDCFTDAELKNIIELAYKNFSEGEIAPLKKLKDNILVLELFHGPTLAFKDFAMQILGQMFETVLKRNNAFITIAGATSGDTGSAAIAAFKNSERAKIFILHPHNKVSDAQRKQMTTVISPNVKNIAVEGSFDDCQNIVKGLFADAGFKEKYSLSAVNSINWARIAAQIVYYFYAALKADEKQEGVSFCVPTGNFGNIFAAYTAKQMGLNIKRLIIASNANDILTRFINSGVMEQKGVTHTLSPSMDIQISSNFERLLFDFCARDQKALNAFMARFKETGRYDVPPVMLSEIKKVFTAFKADDGATLEVIKSIYAQTGVILDPHSAVGVNAALQYNGSEPVITLATAHPAKFGAAVKKALNVEVEVPPSLKKFLEGKERFEVLPVSLEAVKLYMENNA